MAIAARHRRAGVTHKVNRQDYVIAKAEHMRRLGLVVPSQNHTGYGLNGGACPDWLKDQQLEAEKLAAKARMDQGYQRGIRSLRYAI